MQYRSLGRTGVQVSVFTLGSMLFGNGTSAEQAAALVDRALDAGINALDTADVYARGESERILGDLLRRGGRRDRMVLSSKGHVRMDDDDPNAAGSSRRHIIEACDASLRRLNTDHLDLYYLHRPDTRGPIDETLRALDDLTRAGKIRYVGTSSFAAWQVLESPGEINGWSERHFTEQAHTVVDTLVDLASPPAAPSRPTTSTTRSPTGVRTSTAGDRLPPPHSSRTQESQDSGEHSHEGHDTR